MLFVVLVTALLFLGLLGALGYTVPDSTIVYVTNTGTKYHRDKCTYLHSKNAMTIAEAEKAGYSPCSRCDPDQFTGDYVSNWDGRDHSGSGSSSERDNGEKKREEHSEDEIVTLVILAVLFIGSAFAESQPSRTHRKSGRGATPEIKDPFPKENKALLRQEKERYTALYSGKSLQELAPVPPGVEIGADGLPKVKGAKGWGKKFTVYISPKGKRYHKKRGCCGATAPVHIWEAGYRMSACSKCCKDLPDLEWYREYVRIKGIREKYGIR